MKLPLFMLVSPWLDFSHRSLFIWTPIHSPCYLFKALVNVAIITVLYNCTVLRVKVYGRRFILGGRYGLLSVVSAASERVCIVRWFCGDTMCVYIPLTFPPCVRRKVVRVLKVEIGSSLLLCGRPCRDTVSALLSLDMLRPFLNCFGCLVLLSVWLRTQI